MFVMTVTISAKQIEKRKLESYTTSYYLNMFNNVLVPQINEYLIDFKLTPYNQEKGEEVVSGIIQIVKNHVAANNIILTEGMQFPVTLVVLPSKDNTTVVYYANLTLTVIEYDPRSKLTSLLGLSKNFFCGMKSTAPKQDV